MAKTKKKTGCIIAVIIVLVLIIAVIVAAVKGMGMLAQSMQSTSYGTVEIKDLSSYVNVSGTVTSSDTIEVTSEVQQKILTLNVRVGDRVKKGDVLCEFDPAPLQEQFDKLSASSDQAQDAEDYHLSILRRNLNDAKQAKTSALNQADQAIRSAENARDQAYNTYNSNVDAYNQLLDEIANADPDTAAALQERADALAEANAELYPQLAQLEEAVTSAYSAYKEAGRAADQGIQAAQDAIDAEKYTVSDSSASEQMKKLQEEIDSCTVTAPADGVVTQINVAEGSLPMAQSLMTIENTESLMIRGSVSEADILSISEGMECEIKTTATGDDIINGYVSRIENFIPAAAALTENPGYAVEITIDDQDSKLLMGMSANVKIILDKVDQALGVPYDAVRGGENEGYFVFALVPTETPGMVQVVKKNVEIGFEGDYFTEITSGELKEGDMVMTTSYDFNAVQEGDVIPDPSLNGGAPEVAE